MSYYQMIAVKPTSWNQAELWNAGWIPAFCSNYPARFALEFEAECIAGIVLPLTVLKQYCCTDWSILVTEKRFEQPILYSLSLTSIWPIYLIGRLAGANSVVQFCFLSFREKRGWLCGTYWGGLTISCIRYESKKFNWIKNSCHI